ncbi:MAG: RNA polymerase sigma factor [Planctomycetota bacterium]
MVTISVTDSEVIAFYMRAEALFDADKAPAGLRELRNDGSNRGVMNRRLRNALKGLNAPDVDRRRRAMEPFVRETFQVFIRYLYRYLGNEVECEDVLEDVYGDIWENPDRLRDIESQRQLLRTVYLYYMRKRLREVYRRMNRHLYLAQKDLTNLTAPELGLLDTMSQSELKEALGKALSRLKARERRAIELWLDGMSVRAIANELKTTVGAVKMLKFRTILKLKEMMSEYCHDQ